MDKLKKIIFTILGILMLFKILGIDVDVFAVDYGYDKYTSSNYYYSYIDNTTEGYCSPDTFDDDDLTYYGSYINGSTDFSLNVKQDYINGDLRTDYIQRFILRVYGESDYVYSKDNVYTLRYTFNFKYVQNNPSLHSTFLNYLNNNYQVATMTGNTDSTMSGASASNIDNYSYYWKEGSVDGRYLLYITFKPSTDIKFVSAVVKPISSTYNINKLVYGSYNVGYLKITYTEGMNAVIEQQTVIIQQKFEDMFTILQNNSDKTEETITDDTPPDDEKTSAFVDGMVGYLPPGPLDSILNLPLTFLNAYMSGLTGSCKPIDLTIPFVDENMQLSCPNTILTKIDGFGILYDFIGIVASAYILLKYLMSLYVWVDRTLTFRENNEPGYFDEP